jgi:hypothetical protein
MDIITTIIPYLIISAVIFIIGSGLICGIVISYSRGYERV